MFYLSEVDILGLHDAAIRLYGGKAGLRDRDALGSCMAQPKTAVFGTERFPTPAEKAAAYCFFITRLHPFHDGNKRTGFLAGLHFLLLNGIRPAFDTEETFVAITAVARGETDIDELTRLFQEAVSS